MQADTAMAISSMLNVIMKKMVWASNVRPIHTIQKVSEWLSLYASSHLFHLLLDGQVYVLSRVQLHTVNNVTTLLRVRTRLMDLATINYMRKNLTG